MAATTLSPFQQTAERASQVEELLRLHPATETLNRDATLFQLPLRLPGGIRSALRIALPASFPAAPPTLSLTTLMSSNSASSSSNASLSSLRHTWVDPTSGLVSCPSVLSWDLRSGTSKLARAVGEAVEALREGGSSDPNNSGGAAAASADAAGPSPPSTSASSSVEAAPSFPLPRGPFQELESASEEQLLSWLGDAEAFADLVRRVAARVRAEAEAAAEAEAEAAAAAATTAAATKQRSNSKEAAASKKAPSSADNPSMLQSPEAAAAALSARLAAATLAREQELREVSNQAAVVRATELAPAAAAAAQLRARARVVAAAISPRALVDALRSGAARADADSTRCYDAFLAAGGERGAAAAAAAAAAAGNSSSSAAAAAPSSSPPPGGSAAAAAAAAAAGQRALDSFLDEYVRLRSKYHERELKQQAAEQTLL